METRSPYHIERLETAAQLDALGPEWGELMAGIPDAPIFLAWEWVRIWWQYFGRGHKLWLLTARDAAGCLAGLAPLMQVQTRCGLANLRVLTYIGAGLVYPVHLDILARPADQDGLAQAFLDYLNSRSGEWDAISLASTAQTSPLNRMIPAAGGRAGASTASPYIPLPSSWELYSKTLSKHLKRNLRYFRTRLENEHPGKVSFACLSAAEDVDKAVDRLEELGRSRWHARGQATAFDSQAFCGFHKALAQLALEKGWLRFYQLTVEGLVVALFYCFRFHDRIYAYQMSFDVDWSRYSPGRLLIAYGIQSAIQEAACELDWLAGEHAYKLAWTDQIRADSELLLRGTWRGGLWIGWQGIQRTLKAKAKQALPQAAQERLQRLVAAQPSASEEAGEKDER
ncbi:MAG: GNAT family N-acetyltransferase [Chloroflexi bacterium]|nr:GNAT family N-acetyltransferase [Chloroflexota bacterium]